MTEQKTLTVDELVSRVRKMRQDAGVDLSLDEDLSLAIMNLVSLEEHFFFTGEKTGKPEYFDLLREARELRKQLLGRMIPSHEGETWCVSKHLLAATMRLLEVGTKLQAGGKKQEAREIFDRAYQLYGMFWALRLKLADVSALKKIPADALNVHDKNPGKKPWTMDEILNKLVDCCNE